MIESQPEIKRYPIMQNPGVPGVVDSEQKPAKTVLIINGNEENTPEHERFDEVVNLYPNGEKHFDNENDVLEETTMWFPDE